MIKEVGYLDPETNVKVTGSVYLAVCRNAVVPKGCDSKDNNSFAYFFDHEKRCFPLSVEKQDNAKKTKWSTKFQYEVI